MGQVPAPQNLQSLQNSQSYETDSVTYLVIGGGRVARHFSYYLSLEGISHLRWQRTSGASALQSTKDACTHVLLLISDPAIETFYQENAWLKERTVVHFSGTYQSQEIFGAHPLMTFSSSELYDLETYRQIPFALEAGRSHMAQVLPGLRNPHFQLQSENKVLYHALCAMSGNFTVLLWEKVFREFSNKLGLPKEVQLPYMQRIFKNLANSSQSESVLTGPLARGDRATVDRHLHELSGDPYEQVYRAFVSAFSAETTKE